MKVLFITHCTKMAGANRSMYQLIIELRDVYGITPFVLLPNDNSKQRTLKDFLLESNIPYMECTIPFYKLPNTTLADRLAYVHYFREIEALSEKFKPIGFDLVHSNSSVIDFGGYISRVLGVKHVWHLRDFGELDYGLYSIWGNLYNKATYRNGDKFIAISKAVKKYFERSIPSKKIQVIYNGIKVIENISLAKHKSDIVQFLCAGVICEAKNQMEILRAVDILVNKRSVKGLHLTFVGAGGDDYLSSLMFFAKKKGISDFVSFLSEVDGIANLASTMDVGIMSSHCEAFGRTTVEYMFQNLAVIANDSGANTEIITNGKTGLIYLHDSADSLADKMQLLIENRELLDNLSRNGREDAIRRFQSKDNTRLIFELYQNALREPRTFQWNIFLNPKWIMSVKHYKDVLRQRLKGIHWKDIPLSKIKYCTEWT